MTSARAVFPTPPALQAGDLRPAALDGSQDRADFPLAPGEVGGG